MSQLKVLICEDEQLVALELQQRLQSLGYGVPGIVSSASEAIEATERTQPDLVLMDLRLNGVLCGTEIADFLDAKFDVPSLYLTAYADAETVKLAEKTNPIGYLVKPVGDRELQMAIKFGMAQRRTQKMLKQELDQATGRFGKAQHILEDLRSSLASEARMKGLQDIVGGVSHHLNNSLMGLYGALELLQTRGTLQSYELRLLKGVVRSCDSLRVFLQKLLRSAGRSGLTLASHSLQAVISDALHRASPKLGRGAKLSLDIPKEAVSVFVDAEALTQCIQNVVENAMEATGENGKISVSLASSYEELPEWFNTRATTGWYHVVTVKDSGSGIADNDIEKVAEPFFTTKNKREV